MAQLVEWSFPIPEVCGSNPVIGKNSNGTICCQLNCKDENKEMRPGKTSMTERVHRNRSNEQQRVRFKVD